MRCDPEWLDKDEFSWSVGYTLASLAHLAYSDTRAIRRALETGWNGRLSMFSIGRSQGFVATSDSVVVVAFRGTDQIGDWWDNIDVSATPTEIVGGGVHSGFLRAYNLIRDTVSTALDAAELHKGKRLWLTGHSLGGSLATIAAMDHAARNVTGVVTFGQPRSFDRAAVNQIGDQLRLRFDRIVNEDDVVPRIPRSLGHAGRLRLLNENGPIEHAFEDLDLPENTLSEAGPPPLAPGSERALYTEVKAVDLMSGEGLFGGNEPGQGAEGLIPGIRHHRMALYADRLREAARATQNTFQGESSSLTASRIEAQGIDHLASMTTRAGLFGKEDSGIEALGRLGMPGANLPDAIADRLSEPQPVVILLRNENWTPPEGVVVDTRVGPVVTAMARPEHIAKMERDGAGVRSIEISRDVEAVELHKSGDFVNARTAQRPPISERGAHALFGIIDTGIDILHQAFLDAEGRTRIHAIWDQFDDDNTYSPSAVDANFGPSYGRLWLQHEIQALIDAAKNGEPVPPRLRDPREHGTHVAGIAAGRAVGTLADGMAPETLIVAVIPRLSPVYPSDPPSLGYSKTHVDAIYFLKRVAQGGTAVIETARPMAVNVSLGMMAGPHDGRTPLERAFDRVVDDGYATGFAVIKSAGNSAYDAVHAKAKLCGGWQDLSWTRAMDELQRRDYFEAWHHGTDHVEFRVVDPEGRSTGICTEVNPSIRAVLGGNVVRLDLTPTHPDNGDAQLVVAIDADSQPIQKGRWCLRLRANVVRSRAQCVDVWTEHRRNNPVRFDIPSAEGSLSVPGTADYVISVGACGDQDGALLASFSSQGPTRDGRDKPDVCAPGIGISSALANTSQWDAETIMDGTSMSAPHVTGAILLMFSRLEATNATQATVAEIIGDLRRHASSMGGFHTGFGSGVLNVMQFLDAVTRRHPPQQKIDHP